MKTADQIWIEVYLRVAGAAEVIGWAEQLVAAGDDLAFDPEVLELASLPADNPRKAEQAIPTLRRIVERLMPDFSLTLPAAQAHARECLKAWCTRLLNREITPYEFCRIVHPIEEGFHFPDWLGNFYNECDWIEPHYEPADTRHLYDYAEQYLSAVNAGAEPP